MSTEKLTNHKLPTESIGERVRRIRKDKGLTQVELASLLGYETKVAVSNIESGRMNPSIQALIELSRQSGRSLEWILTGEDTPIGRARSGLAAKSIDMAVRQLRELGVEYSASGIIQPAGEEVRLVGQMPAGVGVDLMDEVPAAPSLYLPFKDCRGAVGFTILGDSMEDQYHDGDIVIVKPRPISQVIHDGNTYCIDYEVDGKLYRTVKDVYREEAGFRLRSKNGKYKDLVVKDVIRFFRIIREIREFTHKLA